MQSGELKEVLCQFTLSYGKAFESSDSQFVKSQDLTSLVEFTKWSAWSFPMDYLGLTDGH
jgi:hypothetical protein